jgi:ABC-2 type transport system ATP-binding protein
MAVLKTENLSKKFGPVTAIHNLNLEIERGAVVGLIGPDGAGKSTLLRLFVGLLGPSEGTVSLGGRDVAKNPFRVKEAIGYMPQHFSLYGDLTVAENMKFFADLYGVEKKAFAARKSELLRFSALGPFEDRLTRNLSGGMQKKLALTCNLFHTPEILLLDEPTTGVDPVSRRELWNLLNELNRKDVTILMTTPYMDEASRCHKVGFIFEGRILAYDTPQNLIDSMADEIIELVAPLAPALKALKKCPGLKSVHPFGDTLHIVVEEGRAGIALIRKTLDEETVSYQSLKRATPSFEDVFLALAQRQGRPSSSQNFNK